MARKIHPSPEMVKDLQQVFAKHNWNGSPVGLTASATAVDATCPPGTTPQPVTYKLPDGTWVTTTLCV